MIKELVYIPVRDAVKAKGLPYGFLYAEHQVPEKVGTTRLFFELDAEAGDRAAPTRSQRKNGKRVGVRAVGCRVVIFASSAKEGAQRSDHEALALQIANMVQVSLHHVVLRAKTLWRMRAVGFAADQTTDGWAGRVYVMRFEIDTPVADLTWRGDEKPEGSLGGAASILNAAGNGVATSLPSATTRAT